MTFETLIARRQGPLGELLALGSRAAARLIGKGADPEIGVDFIYIQDR